MAHIEVVNTREEEKTRQRRGHGQSKGKGYTRQEGVRFFSAISARKSVQAHTIKKIKNKITAQGRQGRMWFFTATFKSLNKSKKIENML